MAHLLDLLSGRSDEPALDRAALELARIEYPALEIDPFLAILDSYAVELASRLGDPAGGAAFVAAANQYLFYELGFTGNQRNYHDPRNSCLNEVLTARTGIPITLAVVYLEIGRRLAQPVQGVGLPGHFLVEYRDAGFATYIDVFDGGKLLTQAECFEVASRAAGERIPADPALLAPVTKRQILLRMLNNLRGIYLHRRAHGKALEVLNLLLAGDPENGAEIRKQMRAVKRNLAALN